MKLKGTFIILALCLIGLASPALAGPLISVESYSYDLGDVKQGDVAEATVWVENVGDSDLVIKELESS